MHATIERSTGIERSIVDQELACELCSGIVQRHKEGSLASLVVGQLAVCDIQNSHGILAFFDRA
ncbi:hypothetical protein [Mycobacterium simiae]|uniref:hypothetical protein n=1 Tax=Mycobacterium simiae TaxID=1784 RepID=UPI00165EDC62|nr:hypothetical protein [Mycobacterium simiae]